jgi:hypothetical protein
MFRLSTSAIIRDASVHRKNEKEWSLPTNRGVKLLINIDNNYSVKRSNNLKTVFISNYPVQPNISDQSQNCRVI